MALWKMGKGGINTIVGLLIIAASSHVFAYTYRAEEYVYGYYPFIWSAYCNAYFDATTGQFASHGSLDRVNKPSNTSIYTYEVFQTVEGNTNYSAKYLVTGKMSRWRNGRIYSSSESKSVTVHSSGQMR